ncbi:FAR1-related sequence 5-like protein [Tanacetum coccineum]
MGSTSDELTPNEGSKFWIPDAKNKPVEGTVFDILELALKFYKAYAREGRQGLKPPAKNEKKKTDKVQPAQSESQVANNVIQRRKRASQRCGCEAKLRIKRTYENKWRVYKFLEKHNHRLVREEDYMYLKVLKEMYGGFENVGVTHVECRNYKRDLTVFIGNRDAQMVVEKLNVLADEQSKQYYDAFGDVVSFDATFRSNRYNMVLVSFTGIDNHNRCILFGAALLASENTKKYRHRLCMWHIMKKLSGKVGPDLSNNTNFKKRLCDIVLIDKIDPEVFEYEWRSIMQDFALNGHKWLNDMYLMRSKWIPAYFRHEPMSGLMRTTSGSESENHFLGQLTNPDLTLVEFLSHYDTAIDSQRFKYGKNTHDSNYTTPDFKTHLDIEKEATELYTHTLFYDVQDEIWCSLMHCHSLNVKYVLSECSVKCSCLRYETFGLLCRHIFYVLRMSPVYRFPKQYLQRRWSKNAMLMKSVNKSQDVASGSKSESVDCVLREIYSNVEQSVTHLMNMNAVYASTLGVTEPKEVTIPPNDINNKGNIIRTRLKSKSEIAMNLLDRPKRLCMSCLKYTNHDSRNCPLKKGLQDNDVADVVQDEGVDTDMYLSD